MTALLSNAPISLQIPPYLPHSTTSTTTASIYASSNTTRTEILRFQNRDLHTLLQLANSTNKQQLFMQYITHDASLHQFLDSYFREHSRPYDIDITKRATPPNSQREREQDRLENLLHRRVFMLLVSTVVVKHSYSHSSSSGGGGGESEFHGRSLFTTDRLLDVCALYGYSNPDLVRRLLTHLVVLEPRYLTREIRSLATHVLRAVGQCLERAVLLRRKEQHSVVVVWGELLQLARFVYDLTFSLRMLLEVFPLAAHALHDVVLAASSNNGNSCLAMIYDVILPLLQDTAASAAAAKDDSDTNSDIDESYLDLYVKQSWTNTVHITLTILLECYRCKWSKSGFNAFDRYIAPYVAAQPQEGNDDTDADALFAPIARETLQGFRTWITTTATTQLPTLASANDGDNATLLRRQRYCELLCGLASVQVVELDVSEEDRELLSHSRGSFLLDLCHRGSIVPQLLELMDNDDDDAAVEGVLDRLRELQQLHEIPVPLHVVASKQSTSTSPYAQQIASVREVFPDLGAGFLHLCLEHYAGNASALTDALLESTRGLPAHLAALDRTMESIPATQPPPPPLVRTNVKLPSMVNFDTYGGSASGGSTAPPPPPPSVSWEHVNMFRHVKLGNRKVTLGGGKNADDDRLSEDARRRILESYMYDDEEDDTYEGIVQFDVDRDGTAGDYRGGNNRPSARAAADGSVGGDSRQQKQKHAASGSGTTAAAATAVPVPVAPAPAAPAATAAAGGNHQQQSKDYRRKESHKARVGNHDRKRKALKKSYVPVPNDK